MSNEAGHNLPPIEDVKRVRKLEMIDNKLTILEEGKTDEMETREQAATKLGSKEPPSRSNIGFRKPSLGMSVSSKGERVESIRTPPKKGSILPDVFAKNPYQYQQHPTYDDLSKTNMQINQSAISLIQEANTLEPSERPLHIPDPIGPNLL